jgi:FlaA1/EpsC-like NDP-sugar epimerase
MIYTLKNRNFWIMLFGDAVLILLSYFFAYYLRFDGHIPPKSLTNFMQTVIWIVPLKLACFFFFDVYKGMWRYTSIHDLTNLIKACLTSSAIITVLLLITVRFAGFARSVFIIDFLLTFLFVSGYRIGIRLFYSPMNGRFRSLHQRNRDTNMKRLLIYGAGAACEMLLREIRGNANLRYDVVGLIDDDLSKLGHTIHGVPVLGTVKDMSEIVKNSGVEEIIIAIASASAIEMRHIVKSCETTGVPYKTLPGMGELIEGRVSVSAIREVRYEDLLGRKQVDLNMEQIGGYLTRKRVIVTGGAGSIGSELCRQIAPFRPESLIIVDKDESGLYETELNLLGIFPEMQIDSFLGSVQNRVLMERVFHQHEPHVVFHAAAYKHVPMMELHPWEAVFNNIIGTQAILTLCSGNGVDRCVVVSTDKAVWPTNVMGASKRVDEILAQIYAKEYNARFMSVRFGNVVGSVGSVIPLFQKQIQRGGPVTVTHREATRYFMTIPEASRLILQAGAIGSGGEIFILKMGTPICIADMARDLIKLSGFKPDEDIEIRETGLRPGEKLFEELITQGEGIQETEHEEIMVLRSDNHISMEEMNRHIERLVKLAQAADARGIKEELKRVVPEYEPQDTESML